MIRSTTSLLLSRQQRHLLWSSSKTNNSLLLLRRSMSSFLEGYETHVAEREAQNIAPKPLDAKMVQDLIDDLATGSTTAAAATLKELLASRVPPGVDEAAYVKASYLTSLAKGEVISDLITKSEAVELLGNMQGGYNVATLVELLASEDEQLARLAGEQLKHTLLIFDAYFDVENLAKAGNAVALSVIESWASAEWFLTRGELPDEIRVTVFKVSGETNTDDLSPAPDAWSRPDIPLHAQAMLKNPRDGIEPDVPGEIGPITMIEKLKEKGHPLAYVGDVVGTGSSRKSATNSILWHFGDPHPTTPNMATNGVVIANKIAPIFYNTLQDSGALPLITDVTGLNTGDVLLIKPREGTITNETTNSTIELEKPPATLLDEWRAGGRIPLIIGRGITARAQETMDSINGPKEWEEVFNLPGAGQEAKTGSGFSLAQKMVGKACGLEGVLPGTYVEPKMTTVGSQDTTGPMTRDELKSLACLGFSADLVMQSFCHTAAYPKPVDVVTHATLPDFIRTRGGVSLRPGDGIIHSWLNRMLLPDTVGTGGDSHTRFPIGISFPAGSGLVAFAAATGIMPLDMPESVLVKFHGEMQPGVTLRDLVQAIPYTAIQQGLLTVEKQNKKNIFSGRVLEIEGLGQLKCEQAFELSDASAERSAAGCTIALDEEPVIEYMNSNIVMLKWMIDEGYGDARTLERRIARMEEWLANPVLMKRDENADYAAVIDIDLNELKEPILACPNDPDDSKLLSEVAGTNIDEVFIGSCMTNIGHFRAAGKLLKNYGGVLPTRLWVSPPTKMDEAQLVEEGYYSIYGTAGARTEMPGCSLCMGNQARVAPKSTVISTSTRNFPNRLGQGANVFLGSAELAAVAAIEGKLPTPEEYLKYMEKVNTTAADTYRYLNFNELPDFVESASHVEISPEMVAAAKKLQSV